MFEAVYAVIEQVCRELAKDIVRDGEGATKFVEINVTGGHSDDDCARVAYAVAESPLVKTALFASDPNWGRILAAIGRAGVLLRLVLIALPSMAIPQPTTPSL